MPVRRAVKARYQFIVHFGAGDPCAFADGVVRNRRACCNNMLYIKSVLRVTCYGGGHNTSLRMSDERYRVRRPYTGPFHGCHNVSGTVGLGTLACIRAHKVYILCPSERGIHMPVCSGDGDKPAVLPVFRGKTLDSNSPIIRPQVSSAKPFLIGQAAADIVWFG